jgi:hypothetical protein
MRGITWAAIAAVALGVAGLGSLTGASAHEATARAVVPAAEAYAQRRLRLRRAPLRIRVTPLARPELPSNAVRQCVARLVQENRPSGTVVVPRMWCWWERG